MQRANNFILISGIIIIGVGALNATLKKQPETAVFAGGIGLLVLASLLDALGPGPARLANGLMGLALTAVLLTEAPGLFSALTTAQQKKGTTS